MDRLWERAVRAGDVDAVAAMLKAGADVDARDRHGQTGLMLAAHCGHRAVAEALIAAGANLDAAAKYNLTALMLAIVAGHAAPAPTGRSREAVRPASPARRRMIWPSPVRCPRCPRRSRGPDVVARARRGR